MAYPDFFNVCVSWFRSLLDSSSARSHCENDFDAKQDVYMFRDPKIDSFSHLFNVLLYPRGMVVEKATCLGNHF